MPKRERSSTKSSSSSSEKQPMAHVATGPAALLSPAAVPAAAVPAAATSTTPDYPHILQAVVAPRLITTQKYLDAVLRLSKTSKTMREYAKDPQVLNPYIFQNIESGLLEIFRKIKRHYTKTDKALRRDREEINKGTQDVEPTEYRTNISLISGLISEARRFVKEYVDNVQPVLQGLKIAEIEASLNTIKPVLNNIEFDLQDYNEQKLTIFEQQNENLRTVLDKVIQKLKNKEIPFEYDTLFNEMAGITKTRTRTRTTPFAKKTRITLGGNKPKSKV